MGRMRLLSQAINGNANQVEGFCLVKSVTRKNNVKGVEYLDLVLADADGEIDAKLWDYAPEAHGLYEADTVIKVRGTLNLWKDTEQLKIERIRNLREGEADSLDMSALIPCAPRPPQEMYDEIVRCVEGFVDPDLKLLTQYLLRERKEQILTCPAALKLHHAMRGGLLFHTTSMLEAAREICALYKRLYPSLSEELVFAGVILHDVAKCIELSVGELGLATGYSMPGQLIGHIDLGVAMLERAAAELMIEEGTLRLMQHILLSHHGQAEYGSPKPPMFPEAEIVSTLDVLDARLFEMFDALGPVRAGEFSERQWALDNRQLYKHGHI